MYGDTENIRQDIVLRIYLDHLCTSCQIPSMNKKDRSKNPLRHKAPFKWVFMNIIPAIAPKRLTSETIFSNYLLIVDEYFKTPTLYGVERISTEEVMEKLEIFLSRFGKIEEFGWWYLERISVDTGKQFTSK